jgi:hypothetical protein
VAGRRMSSHARERAACASTMPASAEARSALATATTPSRLSPTNGRRLASRIEGCPAAPIAVSAAAAASVKEPAATSGSPVTTSSAPALRCDRADVTPRSIVRPDQSPSITSSTRSAPRPARIANVTARRRDRRARAVALRDRTAKNRVGPGSRSAGRSRSSAGSVTAGPYRSGRRGSPSAQPRRIGGCRGLARWVDRSRSGAYPSRVPPRGPGRCR